MIVVKVELHSAITGKVTEIGRMKITNDGTGDINKGNYDVKIMRKGSVNTVQKTARVENHSRLNESVWKLVKKALNGVLHD